MEPIKFIDLIPTGKLRRQLDDAYERVMSSGRYVGGAEVEAFEQEWAEYLGASYCVACGNGFDALQLIYRALGTALKSIIVPAWTAPPVWAAVEAIGAIPSPRFPYDGLSNHFNTVVHLYGIPNEIDGATFVEDCAQAHGATGRYGIKCGTLNHAAWSFYPTKNLGCYGDGGAITTDDEGLADKLRRMRNYGDSGLTGINSRLDPLQAAFLRAKLPYLDGWNSRRREIAAMYLEDLRDVPVIELPEVPEWATPVWHQFVIKCRKRDELKAHLAENGIETMIHYPVPPHRALGYDYDLPEADRLAATVLSLPIAPHLRDEEVKRVIEAVRSYGRN